jgi:hypothetical protein
MYVKPTATSITNLFSAKGKSIDLKQGIIYLVNLKVPKRVIFDRSDFPDFSTIKSSWVGDLLVKILTYYFNF